MLLEWLLFLNEPSRAPTPSSSFDDRPPKAAALRRIGSVDFEGETGSRGRGLSSPMRVDGALEEEYREEWEESRED